MTERYSTYRRPRSPTMSNPARASLPIHVGGHYRTPVHDYSDGYGLSAPSPRRETAIDKPSDKPRTSMAASTNSGSTTTTTYKINPSRSTSTRDSSTQGSTVREGSRTRGYTVDSHPRPVIVTTAAQPKHRPHVPHSARPLSPLTSPYRTSNEDYYLTPASSFKHGSNHRKRYSTALDNADMNRLATDRERERERVRAGPVYAAPKHRGSTYTSNLVQHPESTLTGDYGENGYGYTNPRDLVEYDLKHEAPKPSTRDSFEGGRGRPLSNSGYADVARSYDPRERGPPVTVRGFDKIQPRAWEQPVRPPSTEPVPQRPLSRIERVEQPLDAGPQLRRSLSGRPPVVYQDRDARRPPREDYYEARDDDLRRERRHDRHEDSVEQRGYGVRSERERNDRPERPERVEHRAEKPDREQERVNRPERNDWHERNERQERSDRLDRERVDQPPRADWLERGERERPQRSEQRADRHEQDRQDRPEGKTGRDKIAAGLSTAAAALGFGGIASDLRKNKDDDREDHRRQRDFDDEHLRRREAREEVEPDQQKDRRRRDDGRDAPREYKDWHDNYPTSPREGKERMTEAFPPLEGKENYRPQLESKESNHRPTPREHERLESEGPPRGNTRDRIVPETAYFDPSRDTRERDRSTSQSRRPRSDATTVGSAADSRSDTSDDATLRPTTERRRRISGAAFNPKDKMDLKALKDALNAQKESPPKESALTKNPSFSKDHREIEAIRSDLNNHERGRDYLQPLDRKVRLVSPARDKPEEKPVKGILRQPREKFPEDPSPIREGVAPLKDAKKDGVPPDARWTKIARKLVNPEALEAGKERYEAREDFVIVLRVLSREEIQDYAIATQKIRATREEEEARQERESREDRRRTTRRERHERHRRERKERRHKDSHSESETTEDEKPVKMLEQSSAQPSLSASAPVSAEEKARKRASFADDPVMSGALPPSNIALQNLRELPDQPGSYTGYMRNPPTMNGHNSNGGGVLDSSATSPPIAVPGRR